MADVRERAKQFYGGVKYRVYGFVLGRCLPAVLIAYLVLWNMRIPPSLAAIDKIRRYEEAASKASGFSGRCGTTRTKADTIETRGKFQRGAYPAVKWQLEDALVEVETRLVSTVSKAPFIAGHPEKTEVPHAVRHSVTGSAL